MLFLLFRATLSEINTMMISARREEADILRTNTAATFSAKFYDNFIHPNSKLIHRHCNYTGTVGNTMSRDESVALDTLMYLVQLTSVVWIIRMNLACRTVSSNTTLKQTVC